jgi:WhiB family redox-sensing transcriptional regulator
VRLTERQRDTDSVMRLLMRPGDVPIVTFEDLLMRPAWQARAACHDASPEVFFLRHGQSARPGLALCEGCEVRAECLDFAMADPGLEGMWGGTTARERRRLRQAAS